jgi:membrane-associated protein
MELIAQLVDIFLHLDNYLGAFLNNYGLWVYALLFVIIFAETGFVVTPFLPGDSLLFVAGTLAAGSGLDVLWLIPLLIAASFGGDNTNYWIGHHIGPRVFRHNNSWLLNHEHLDRTRAFYERHGGKTILLARFLPILRTFAPFVAGVAQMTRSKFSFYDVSGGTLWVGSLVTAGYLFGNIAWVQANLSKIIWALILVPGLIALYGGWRARHSAAS